MNKNSILSKKFCDIFKVSSLQWTFLLSMLFPRSTSVKLWNNSASITDNNVANCISNFYFRREFEAAMMVKILIKMLMVSMYIPIDLTKGKYS